MSDKCDLQARIQETSAEKIQLDIQKRLESNITTLKQAQTHVRDADTPPQIERDMMEPNGLIASIIARLEYQYMQNAKVIGDGNE